MNDLFKGIPFFKEDKTQECMLSVIIATKENKGKFCSLFQSFLQVFERAFCRTSPITKERNDRLKPGK